MRKERPDLFGTALPDNPLGPAYTEVKPIKAEYMEAIAASLKQPAYPAGVQNVTYGEKTANRILKVANVIELDLPDRRRDPARRLDDPDREHDPPLDLLAPARDRGDEARRRDELVRARAVHARRPASAASAARSGGHPALSSARSSRCRRSSRGSTAVPDVQALGFGSIALILIGIGLLLGAAGSGLTLRRFLRV